MFGRHVAQRPDQVARVRELFHAFGFGEPKISDPDGALSVEKEIGRLDIAMQHALTMSMIQSVGYLSSQAGHSAIEPGCIRDRRETGPLANRRFPLTNSRTCRTARSFGSLDLPQFLDHLVQAASLD